MATSAPTASVTPGTSPVQAARTQRPGIYRGGSPAEFGLWRLRADGVWLFSTPVEGSVWKVAADQSGDKLILLVDETRI